MLSIRGVNEARLRLRPCKEHPQRRSAGLRLAARNLPDHAIGLMLCDEILRAQVDLALELLPRAWPLAAFRHKLAVANLRLPLSGSKLPQHPVSGQPRGRSGFSDRRPIATPAPQARMRHHRGPHGIQHHIATELQEMRVLLHQDRGEAPLEEMSDATMASIGGLRIAASELAHPLRKIRLGRLDQQMVVIVHQTIGMAQPAEAINDMREERQQRGSVLVIGHDVLPGIAATRDMIDGTGIFDA